MDRGSSRDGRSPADKKPAGVRERTVRIRQRADLSGEDQRDHARVRRRSSLVSQVGYRACFRSLFLALRELATCSPHPLACATLSARVTPPARSCDASCWRSPARIFVCARAHCRVERPCRKRGAALSSSGVGRSCARASDAPCTALARGPPVTVIAEPAPRRRCIIGPRGFGGSARARMPGTPEETCGSRSACWWCWWYWRC